MFDNSKAATEKKTVLLIISFMMLFIWLCFFAQKIPVNEGMGWDGISYVAIIKQFPHYVHQFSAYRSTRVFPSTVIALSLRLLDVSLSAKHILMAFEVLNFLAIMGAVLLWWRFVFKLNINFNWRVLSFSGLFLSFPILSFAGYNPVLTDTVAFSLGVILAYCYFMQKPWCTFLVGIVASFTFPTYSLAVFFLILFPNQQSEVTKDLPETSSSKTNHGALLVAFLVIVITFCLFTTIEGLPKLHLSRHVSFSYFSSLVDSIDRAIVPVNLIYLTVFFFILSMAYLFTYSYYGLKDLCFPILFLRKGYKQLTFKSVILATVFYLIYEGLKSLLSNSAVNLGLKNFFLLSLKECMALPVINLIAAFIYYGPIVFFIVFFWRKICQQAVHSGYGAVLSLSLFFFLSLVSESREFNNFIGFLVFILLMVIPKTPIYKLPTFFTPLFVMLSLFFSKCWFTIHIPQTFTDNPLDYLDKSWQDYFMHFGPWMSYQSYFLNLALVVPTVIIIYYFLQPLKRPLFSLLPRIIKREES